MKENEQNKILSQLCYMHEEDTNIAWKKLQGRIQVEKKEDNALLINRVKFTLPKFLALAASIIILVGLSWLTFSLIDSQSWQTIETFANKTEITLSDGSQISLNAYTKLRYPKKFDDGIRKVELSGEAFFKVAKDAKRPFIIAAKDAEIKVLGTSFNVFARDNIKGVSVVVSTGAVSLSSLTNKTERIILSIGEEGNLSQNGLLKYEAKDINYLSWKTQLIDFRNSSLSEVIKVLNNTYTANITLYNEDLANLKLTSKYDHINLDTIIRTVCLAFDLKREDKNGQIILKKSNN